jgi:Ser/Thr protein kinase RdoA (MazF antagonist)
VTDRGQEIELEGSTQGPVVRIGDTVRRLAREQTPAVQALLRHFEAVGFDGAPGALGIDGQGREKQSFVPGEVGVRTASRRPPGYIRTDAYLQGVGRLLRRMHDATRGFVPPPEPSWVQLIGQPADGEVICHNDVGPYNIVCRGQVPVAFIDWDESAPGPREWDIAYALYRCVPFYPDEICVHVLDWPGAPDRHRRTRLFLDAYGWQEKVALFEVMERRIAAMISTGTQRHAAGHPIYDDRWEAVILPRLHRDLEFVRCQ